MLVLIKQKHASEHLRAELVSRMAQGFFVCGAVILCLESQKYFCVPEAYIETASLHAKKGNLFLYPDTESQSGRPSKVEKWEQEEEKTSQALSSRIFSSVHALAQGVRREL